MPDGLALALQTQGLMYMLLAMALAGLVYGFAGFGSALIFVPVSAIFVAPAVAAVLMSMAGLSSVFTVLPRALRGADLKRLAWTLTPAAIATIPGIVILRSMDVTPLRWVICAIIAVALLAMLSGFRRELSPSPATSVGIGTAAGFIGGATGLLGPVIILFNLAGNEPVAVTRANLLSFLTLLGLLLLPMLAIQGLVTTRVLWLGLLTTPVYMVSTLIGQSLFDPSHERLFRSLGYVVIGLAVVVSLPLWD